MILNPLWRTRIFATVAGAVAIWLGVAIAQQEFFWPALAGVGLLLFALARWQPLPLGTLLLGSALVGYVLGNRGFAQIMLLPNQPLLPAEALMMLGGTLLLVQCAWRHELPVRREALNLLVLAWMALGLARLSFDFRAHGLVAVRDFAVVYYAAFFVLAQDAAREPTSRRFLNHTLLASCSLLLLTSFLYERFPEFFLGTLTFRGSPLIYYKGDLVGTFLAVGSVLAYLQHEQRPRWWKLLLSLLLAGGVLATNNRASMLGLVVAAVWLAIGGRWRFARALVGTAVLGSVLVLVAAGALNLPLEKTPLFGVYERVLSLTDPTGQRSYRGAETFNKGDNNLFRSVWWKAVIDETIDQNPYVGVGFGYDLADRFVRQYYPESGEEFSVRSPHNVLVTVFARMGAVGLAVLLAMVAVISRRTFQAVRAGPEQAAPWCVVWVIFSSACFGVVLEGPMGAVVFWTALGVAQAAMIRSTTTPQDVRTEKGPAAALRSAGAPV
ncbi:MAG: O-antigen ligase family protein [Opitutus sp.]